MAKTKKKTKTYCRKVIIKNITHDFGLGPGVLYRDEMTYRERKQRGFDCAFFYGKLHEDALNLLKSLVTVIIEEKEQ